MRAFTRLFDENHREFPDPLFTDTFLSAPIRTHAGEIHTNTHTVCVVCILLCCCVSEPLGGVVEGLSAGMFLIGMMVAVVSLLVYRQRLRKV